MVLATHGTTSLSAADGVSYRSLWSRSVMEFSDVEVERRQQKIAKDNGFILESHAMVLYGTCRDCNAAAAAR